MRAFLFVLLAASFATAQGCAGNLPQSMNMSPPVRYALACAGTRDAAPAGSRVLTSVDTLTLHDSTAPIRSFFLTAKVVKRPGLPDEWTFNGTVPGPELRVREGDHVRVVLTDDLPFSTTIHWHGIDVPNAADGVAGVTQDAVKAGQTYTYDFIAADPGTYWYHSHQDTSNQIPRGLLGALIVEPEKGPRYDKDYALVYHDYSPPRRGFFPILAKILGAVDRRSMAVNGTIGNLALDAEPGDLVRLRLINASAGETRANAVPLHLVVLGALYRVVALDGHDLNGPQEIGPEILPIGAGQRYDLALRIPASGAVRLVDRELEETVTLGKGAVAALGLAGLPVFDLTRYGLPGALPGDRFDASYTLDLGSHPGFHDGKFGLVHTIDGRDFPDTPMIMVRPEEVVKLRFTNSGRTEEFHTMHLHGHSFQVLARNGIPLAGSPVRLDTLLVAPHETWDVAFRADNPGVWMLHCHVLLHAATGMDMMVSYEGIQTPYSVGSATGNIPE